MAGLLAALLTATPASAQQKCIRAETLAVGDSTPKNMSIDAALAEVKKFGQAHEGQNRCFQGVLKADERVAGWYKIEINGEYAKITVNWPHQGTAATTVWETRYNKHEDMKDY